MRISARLAAAKLSDDFGKNSPNLSDCSSTTVGPFAASSFKSTVDVIHPLSNTTSQKSAFPAGLTTCDRVHALILQEPRYGIDRIAKTLALNRHHVKTIFLRLGLTTSIKRIAAANIHYANIGISKRFAVGEPSRELRSPAPLSVLEKRGLCDVVAANPDFGYRRAARLVGVPPHLSENFFKCMGWRKGQMRYAYAAEHAASRAPQGPRVKVRKAVRPPSPATTRESSVQSVSELKDPVNATRLERAASSDSLQSEVLIPLSEIGRLRFSDLYGIELPQA